LPPCSPHIFARIFGINNETVSARAVATNYSGATNGNDNYNCIITLGSPSSSIEGLNINGNATLNAPTCGIADNGNYNTKGNALDVNAGSFGVSGSAEISGPGGTITCTSGQTSCPQYSTPAVGNPLANLPAPSVGAAQNFNPSNAVPGTYNGINITGNGNVNFAPGVYVLTGDFTCHGTPTITGTGVTFFFANNSTFNCSGNDTIQFSAPTSGTYQGILFYQQVGNTNGPTLGGNTGSYFDGVVYFPSSQITFFGNNSSFATGVVIGDSIQLSGHPTVNVVGRAGIPGGLPPTLTLANATLVE
jgi:hypothetical protein